MADRLSNNVVFVLNMKGESCREREGMDMMNQQI